jgi:hypothetical protein
MFLSLSFCWYMILFFSDGTRRMQVHFLHGILPEDACGYRPPSGGGLTLS